MSNILKVTTPVSGYDNSTRNNPITSNSANIKNIIDPSKITRPDMQNEQMEDKSNPFALDYKSNFDKFLQVIRNTPGLTETLAEMLFMRMETVVNSGISENFAEELSKFMEMIKMSPEELAAFIKSQGTNAVKFKGVFFNILRHVINETNSADTQRNILDFLKKYNDLSSANHTLNNIINTLENIVKQLPGKYRQNILEMMESLSGESGGDTAKNMKVLKEGILPFLSNYIGNTHDMGKVRDLISFLTLNMARYENSDKEGFLESFESILGYSSIKKWVGNLTANEITDYLLKLNIESDKGDELMNTLVSIIEKGVKGEAGYDSKLIFENIMNAVLINESVYMPLLHLLIPAEINGSLLFSEIWADPNSGDDKEQGSDEDEQRIKFLIKFDIKDLGFFDVILTSQKEKVDLWIYCPEKLIPMEKAIKSGIGSLIEKNGLSCNNLSVEKSTVPKTISEIFPHIYERKNAINVKI